MNQNEAQAAVKMRAVIAQECVTQGGTVGSGLSAPSLQGMTLGGMAGAMTPQDAAYRAVYEAERKAEKRFQIRAIALDTAVRNTPGATPKDIRTAAEEFADFLLKDQP